MNGVWSAQNHGTPQVVVMECLIPTSLPLRLTLECMRRIGNVAFYGGSTMLEFAYHVLQGAFMRPSKALGIAKPSRRDFAASSSVPAQTEASFHFLPDPG